MHDLVTLGEVLLRLSIPSPGRFETARQLDVQVGGAEANVAAACARLGLKVAWISALPANPWGERTRREPVGHGVDCAHLGTTEQTLEALARLAPRATVSLQLGEAGAAVLDGNRLYRPRHVPAVRVVDPIGAGDAYAAGFLWAVLQKRELQEAVDVGTAVGALKCSMWGDIALITPRDVEEVLAGGPDVRR